MNVVGEFRWNNFTLDKYRYVLFTRPDTTRGFINSFVLAFEAFAALMLSPRVTVVAIAAAVRLRTLSPWL